MGSYAASMLKAGDADAMVTGVTRNYADALAGVRQVLDPPAGKRPMGMQVIFAKGRVVLIADTSVAEFVARASGGRVRVSSPDAARLRQLVLETSSDVGEIEAGHDGEAPTFTVAGLERSVIGDLALHHGIAIHELTSEKASLEQAFMELTADDVEFRAHGAEQPAERPAAPVASHRKA